MVAQHGSPNCAEGRRQHVAQQRLPKPRRLERRLNHLPITTAARATAAVFLSRELSPDGCGSGAADPATTPPTHTGERLPSAGCGSSSRPSPSGANTPARLHVGLSAGPSYPPFSPSPIGVRSHPPRLVSVLTLPEWCVSECPWSTRLTPAFQPFGDPGRASSRRTGSSLSSSRANSDTASRGHTSSMQQHRCGPLRKQLS